MSFKELQWGKNQCLYRAAPYHVIYNPLTGLQELIRPWTGSVDRETSVQLVREALAAELERYPISPIDKKRIKSVKLELRSLDYIQTALYPTAFYCSKCHRIVAVDPGRSDKTILDAANKLENILPKRLRCECGGNFLQWRLLTIHACGETIHVPTFFATLCKQHKSSNLFFEDHGSERSHDWEIVCKAPGCREEGKGYGIFFWTHSDCPLKDSAAFEEDNSNRALQFETAPIQKATNFLPKVMKILNSDQMNDAPRPGTKESIALALGALGAREYFSGFTMDSGMGLWIDRFNTKGELPDPRLKLALEYIEDMKDEQEKTRLRAILTTTQTKRNDGILDDPEFLRLTSTPGYLEEAASISVYQRRGSGLGISDLLEDSSIHEEARWQLENASRLTKDLHIASIRHVEDIALTSCLIGYTRGDYDPAKVKLQMYLQPRADGQISYLIYTNTVRTEGMFLQLDPSATLAWVSRAIDPSCTIKQDFSLDLFELQRRFDSASMRLFRGPSEPWSRRHYVLLHTISHLLVKALGKLSGLEQEGLTERIYPYQNSILIYSNQSTQFSLAGLSMAFEHHLQSILETMQQDAQTCAYNPECETNYGACPACVYLAEISCENFNKVLDRRCLAPQGVDSFWQ